jgi:hypothetical protein
MKKLLISVLAIGVLMAVATSASAVTCTIDQHPAATLLVPYFRAAFNADGTPVVGANSYDTLVTITNNSASAMLAHVVVWNERSVPVLDFDIALTAYDSQSMSMQQILIGNLPQTPKTESGTLFSGTTYGGTRGACQTSTTTTAVGDGQSGSNSSKNEYVRFVVQPDTAAATKSDNSLTTTVYSNPAWSAGSTFGKALLDELDDDASMACAQGSPDGVVTGTVHGYVTIDHVNYCTLSFPNSTSYYIADAIGQENNMTGEVIYTSGAGLPTNGASTVNLEASFNLNGYPSPGATPGTPIRTFYARYWEGFDGTNTTSADTTGPATSLPMLTNETTYQTTCYGDCREPLGLRTESRYFVASGINTYNYVWRGSSDDELGPSSSGLIDLTGPPKPPCNETENTISATLVDENEGTTSSGVTPSPPPKGITSNFPFETGRYSIPGDASLSIPPGSVAGVAYYSFLQVLPDGWADQAWVEYEFDGAGAFISARIPANQMDGGYDAGASAEPFGHSNCAPIGFTYGTDVTQGIFCCGNFPVVPFGDFPPYAGNTGLGLP